MNIRICIKCGEPLKHFCSGSFYSCCGVTYTWHTNKKYSTQAQYELEKTLKEVEMVVACVFDSRTGQTSRYCGLAGDDATKCQYYCGGMCCGDSPETDSSSFDGDADYGHS